LNTVWTEDEDSPLPRRLQFWAPVFYTCSTHVAPTDSPDRCSFLWGGSTAAS
jgi:hypothetical protein